MNRTIAATVVACFAFASSGWAQTATAPSQDATMAGMDMSGGKRPASNMQAMMTRCAAMRLQMRQGAPIDPAMQAMMQDCDKMDKQMGSAKAPYVPPADRTR